MNEQPKVAAFGQADPTDNRELGDWRTKYSDPEARRGIRAEAIYLAVLLLLVPVSMLVLWLGYPKNWLHLTDGKYDTLLRYGLAWLAGVLGGTLYDAKWLYHTVARQLWHLDRRIWRLFTPHISGGLAFVVISLVASGLLKIFDSHAVESNAMVVGVGFLVGYFSDSAIAKLAEIAETLFGTSRSKERHKDPPSTTTTQTAKDKT
jgi:hypothetical protein